MKKIYTLALAATVAFCATAKDVATISNVGKLPRLHQIEALTGENLPLAAKFHKAPAKVASEDVFGDYNWSYLDLIDGKDYTDPVTIIQSEDDATVAGVHGLFNDEILVGAYNAEAGSITLSSYSIGEFTVNKNNEKIPAVVKLEVYKINPDGETFDITTDPFVITFDGKQGKVDENLILAITAYAKADGSSVGYFFLAAFNDLAKDSWTAIGEAEFVDGIMPTFFLENPYTITSKVLVESNDSQPTLLRVLNPWTGTFSALFPDDEDNSSIPFTLEVSDPEYVVMPLVGTGVGTQAKGAVYIGSLNYLGFDTKADFLASQHSALNITRNGNVISFAAKSIGLVYQNEPTQLYISNSLASTLTLPENWDGNSGVSNVEVSGNAPVEYFNLQGVRVANPENGIYIRRQGNKATKVIVK